jgi:hypothetical protein
MNTLSMTMIQKDICIRKLARYLAFVKVVTFGSTVSDAVGFNARRDHPICVTQGPQVEPHSQILAIF